MNQTMFNIVKERAVLHKHHKSSEKEEFAERKQIFIQKHITLRLRGEISAERLAEELNWVRFLERIREKNVK